MSVLTEQVERWRFTPEEEVLLQATRSDDSNPDRLRELLSSPLDWEFLLEHAHAHGVVPYLSRGLSEDPTGVPADVIGHTDSEAARAKKWNLQATQELLAVLDLLEAEDIDVIPYRGPVVAADAYDSLGLRRFNDLDLLIRQGDVQPAKTALSEAGYSPKYELAETSQLDRGQEWAYTHFTRDYAFQHPDRYAPVELHWRILDLYFPTNFRLETVWDRRHTTTIGGREVPTLSPEDRLLMLCIHGSKHCWSRLMWICDVDRVIRTSDLNWEATVERARTHRAERLFLLGPALAHELYGTPLPPRVRILIVEDQTLTALVSQAINRLFESEPLDPLDEYLFRRRSLNRRQDRIRLLVLGFLTPRQLEIETVSLPFPLIWLYFLIRPFRALGVRLGLISE